MTRRTTQDHLPLHPLEFRILLVLLDGDSYGTRIVEEVERAEPEGRPLYPANLFRRIRDLLSDGLVASSTAPEGADPRRSYVRITELGREVAAAEAARLRALVQDAERRALLPEAR